MDDEFAVTHIVIDNGTGYCKAGLSREEEPRSIFQTIVGYPSYEESLIGGDKKSFYIGDEVKEKFSALNFSSPIERGLITNWDDMEKIYGHIFTNELRMDPAKHYILLTEPIMNPRKNREKLAQIMFESFGVPGLYIENTPILNLYAAGKFTGFSVDSGEGLTQFSPENWLRRNWCY